MFLRELIAPITSLRGAGPAAAGALARLGIGDIGALLRHYPRDWEDRSLKVPLRDWNNGRVCTEVKLLAKDWFGFGRMKTLKVYVEDDSARACLVCFNRPFLEKQLVTGKQYRLFGQFYFKYGEIQSSAFEIEPAGGGDSFNSAYPVLPVYPLTAGISQGLLRKLVHRALDTVASNQTPLEDELP